MNRYLIYKWGPQSQKLYYKGWCIFEPGLDSIHTFPTEEAANATIHYLIGYHDTNVMTLNEAIVFEALES